MTVAGLLNLIPAKSKSSKELLLGKGVPVIQSMNYWATRGKLLPSCTARNLWWPTTDNMRVTQCSCFSRYQSSFSSCVKQQERLIVSTPTILHTLISLYERLSTALRHRTYSLCFFTCGKVCSFSYWRKSSGVHAFSAESCRKTVINYFNRRAFFCEHFWRCFTDICV